MMFSQKLIWQIHKYLFIFIWVSHSHVHSDTVLPHLILSLTLNLRSNWGCIWNLAFPFLLPIAAWLLSCSNSGSWVFWPVVFVTLVWVTSFAVVPCFVPLSSPEIYKKGNLVPNCIFCGLIICFGFFLFNWGPRACDTSCDFRFILSFIFIAIVQIVWWEQPVSVLK